MIKQWMLFIMLCLMSQSNIMACDNCGCVVSGSGVGLLSAYRYNFVNLSYNSYQFRGTEGHGDEAKDLFQAVDLNIRYHLSDRWKVLVNQGYRYNTRLVEAQKQSLDGLGDTSIQGAYSIINKQIDEQKRLFVELGGGVKLPFGKYNSALHEIDLPDNFNTGNGSWAGLAQANVLFMLKDIGFVSNTNIQINANTPSGYQFGHQVSTQLSAFYEKRWEEKELSLTPIASAYFESITQDHYANAQVVTGTGGSGFFTSLGANFKYQDWMLGAAYATPLIQNYSNNEVTSGNRISLQLTYIFY